MNDDTDLDTRLLENKYDMLPSLLQRYEDAMLAKAKLMAEHEEVFEELEKLEKEISEVIEASKRILHTKDGPPKEAGGKKVWLAAKSDHFYIEVTYKKRADYYDPKMLPREVLVEAGVVTEVSGDAVQAFYDRTKNKRLRDKIDAAYFEGEYMTPNVSIKRAK